MPHVIAVEDDGVIGVDEMVDALCYAGFDPRDEQSRDFAAGQLRRLGNNRTFLGDILVAELSRHQREEQFGNGYGAQSLLLYPPGNASFFLRANIWPSRQDHALRASGDASFVYGLPHDHNFDFMTLGYFGPGYWSDYYEFDYENVAGWRGEAADLRFVERARLEEGKIMLYRAHRDVHSQLPPDALSVSINIMHTGGAQVWLDQYAFDTDKNEIARILTAGSSEALLRIAAGLGGEEGLDLALQFARNHPSDRVRLSAWGALAARESKADARDAIWRQAELSGSRLVQAEAKAMRTTICA